MKATKRLRSSLTPSITRYLNYMRALGRKYTQEESVLRSLDEFLLRNSCETASLTASTFAGWCETLVRFTPTVRRHRMGVVRKYCIYRQRTEPPSFIPDVALFPSPHQPVAPYIFSEEEIAQLIMAARQLERTDGSPLRPDVYSLAIVLLYTMGLRRRELLNITLGDYDAEQETLLVRKSKYRKSRCLPLSTDGSAEIERYLQARMARRLAMTPETPFIWHKYNRRGNFTSGIYLGIRKLCQLVGIKRPNGLPPRMHDFRHTFAIHALLRWYRTGADVQAKLPLLSTYLGHSSIDGTAHYLRFVEPLARAASIRFAKRFAILIDESSPWKGGSK